MFVPLHVKSHHSLGHGTASPAELVRRAAELGYRALALTDIDTLAAQVAFHELCRQRGLRAVAGVELRRAADRARGLLPRRGRVVLLAENLAGYRGLCEIVSRRRGGAGSEDERRRARDPVTAVCARPSGLFALTDDPDTLDRLALAGAVPAQRLGALLVRPSADPDAEARLLAAAARHGVAAVADPEVVFAAAADHPLHALVCAVHARRTVAEIHRAGDAESPGRWLRNPGEVEALYRDQPEALARTAHIAGRCAADLAPAPVAPGARALQVADPAAELRARCARALEAGRAARRYPGVAYDDRLAHELDAIETLGHAGYVLLAAEVARGARERGIPLATRGSAVGSLAVHLLGVSDVDPIAAGLVFERFLHPLRAAPPDIDLDVCSERRDELLGWVQRRFGPGRVAMVGAHHTFRLRSALRAGLAAVGLGRAAIDRFCAALPAPADPSALELERTAPAEPSLLPSGPLPPAGREALPLIVRLTGTPRHLALHPGGIAIAEGPIDAHLPVERAPRGLVMAQYDVRSLEAAGVVKLDVLGNRLLTQIAETRAHVRSAGRAPREELPGGGAAPRDDPDTLARLRRADTVGCFQVETPAVRALLTKLDIRDTAGLAAALALVRPGAASGDTVRDYIRRARGDAPAEPVHPLIATRLAETHGLLLYDEDLIAALAAVAGISLAAADQIRTAVVDADGDPGALAEIERRFLALARVRGSEPAAARSAWTTVCRFAAYSFSKAHAFSQAALAYDAAHLRTHHPVEFGCALLNGYGGAYPLRTIAADLARSGVRVLGPSVARSQARAEPVGGAIRVGLSAIKHLAGRTAGAIVARRSESGPYRDLSDVLDRVRLSRRELRALVLSGACDGLDPLSADNYPFVHEALVEAREGRLDPRAFERIVRDTPSAAADASRRAVTYRRLVRVRNELVHLDMHLADHPMRILREDAARHGCSRSDELRARATPRGRGVGGARVRFAGLVAASRRHPVGGARAMQFLTLEDEGGLIEAVILPPAYPRLAPRVTTPGPYLVDATLESDRGHAHLIVHRLAPFHERGAPAA